MGAVTAYATAHLAPEQDERSVTASEPHTGHFLLNIRLMQAIRSRYMVEFQLPGWPERRNPRNDFAYLETLIRSWSANWQFGEVTLVPLKQAYADPRRLSAALACYRQLPASLASALSRRLIFAPVATPTRLLYGADDGCIGPELFMHQQSRFTQPLDLVPMAAAGHLLRWEQAEGFGDQIVSLLQRH